jgi:hypothetical protein
MRTQAMHRDYELSAHARRTMYAQTIRPPAQMKRPQSATSERARKVHTPIFVPKINEIE